MNNDMRYIAVFGDTHGHIRLMFQLCRLWQLKHNRWLDGVLQCGDLGFFPDMTQIDKATRRFYKRDPEEMGFARFFSPFGFRETDALLEQTLCGPSDSLETVTAPVYWCHGSTTHKPRYTDAPPMTITEPPIQGQGGKHQRNAPIQGRYGKYQRNAPIQGRYGKHQRKAADTRAGRLL